MSCLKRAALAFLLFTFLFVGFAENTSATTLIDFQTFAAGPSIFATAGPVQNLSGLFDGVSVGFGGGVILTDEINLPADPTGNLYATAFVGLGAGPDPSLKNAIKITFSSKPTFLFLDLYNGLTSDVTYQISDNLNHLWIGIITPNLSSGIAGIPLCDFNSLPPQDRPNASCSIGTEITVTPISGLPFWDFSIDNITFNGPDTIQRKLVRTSFSNFLAVAIPAPDTLTLLGIGVSGLILYRMSRRSKVM